MELTLRAVSRTELAAWLDTGRQPLDGTGLGWHADYPTADTADAIAMLGLAPEGGAPPWGIWQIVQDGSVIGDIGFHGPPDADGAVEIGYQVVPARRRRGVASRAVGLIVAEAVRHGAVTIRAEVVGDNPGSSRSLQHNGFEVVEQHGDTTIWSRPVGGRVAESTAGQGSGSPGRTRRWQPGRRLFWDLLLGAHQRGPGDPTHRRIGSSRWPHWWRATRVSSGPALLQLTTDADEVVATAWGDGAEEVLAGVPSLLGADDDPSGFEPVHPLVAEAHRRHPDLRLGRTGAVGEALFPACLEQVVTGSEAYSAFRTLVTKYGEPAPGPAQEPDSPAYGMVLPPTARGWATIPSWEYLAAGVEQRRSAPLVTAALRGDALERTLRLDSSAADRALQSLPRIGPWTSAETRQRAHGDADAWSIGDYHVGDAITHALRGAKLGDEVALELLEPYAGHRFRAQVLIMMAAGLPPRRGPRRTLPSHTPRATRGRS